jgi:propionyl-CoA carboxylase alpha chain
VSSSTATGVPTPITALLVANRGEIAMRVMSTASAMGILCVAVFVDADQDAPFVRHADEAVRLATSYLDGPAIVEAARLAGADAIHPGYGFLSENAGFARAVLEAGLTWVGPPPAVIDGMGDKLAAKRAAVAAGVPTLPSTEDVREAMSVGFPLLVKAAAGGGGKGMRIVHRAEDIDEAVASARREAAGAFGDDRVFLERYIARARHIEIQILGDRHGGLVHLGERECSIQRRHQKIIEESPSPLVDDAMRRAMGDAALRLAGAIGYESAGTVEFVVDDDTREFYFLEVNTRLQVEHPVTEAVTGIDLVREQLRVASGEPLGVVQDDITFAGHAIEARLYAEDAARGFLPATGTLHAFEPAAHPVVRWDSGVESGSVVSVSFDPMLAKVIAHAPTRAEAAARLATALESLHLAGVTTNRQFLVSSLRHPLFLSGDVTTAFIEHAAPDATLQLDDDDLQRAATAAALWMQGTNRAAAPVLETLPSGWRNARLPPERVAFVAGAQAYEITYRRRRDGTFEVGDAHVAHVHRWSEDGIDLELDGRRVRHRITRAGGSVHVQVRGGGVDLTVVPRFPEPTPVAVAGALTAPMPGVVADVRVAGGDVVRTDQVLVVLEAMKMEHHITAPTDGTVTEVHACVGAQVQNGDLLLVVEAPADDNEPTRNEGS